MMPAERWFEAALTRRRSRTTQSSSARMTTTLAVTAMAAPAFTPLLKPDEESGVEVDVDVAEARATEVVVGTEPMGPVVADEEVVAAVYAPEAGAMAPRCRSRNPGLENWSSEEDS